MATAAIVTALLRRTAHRTIRAEHAAVTGLRLQQASAARALVEVQARVDRHDFRTGMVTLRAREDRLEDHGRHGVHRPPQGSSRNASSMLRLHGAGGVATPESPWPRGPRGRRNGGRRSQYPAHRAGETIVDGRSAGSPGRGYTRRRGAPARSGGLGRSAPSARLGVGSELVGGSRIDRPAPRGGERQDAGDRAEPRNRQVDRRRHREREQRHGRPGDPATAAAEH